MVCIYGISASKYLFIGHVTRVERTITTVVPKPREEIKREQVAKPTNAIHGESDGTVKKQPVRKVQKIGRNDPCPCGSGKKYKQCCGR